MGKLHALYSEFGQSPWLDNLKRSWISSGELRRWVERGCRGITSNPTIFQRAMSTGSDYDAEIRECVLARSDVEQTYWKLVCSDVSAALELLRPTWEESGGEDGFVSVEVSPALAHDVESTVCQARELHERLSASNLYVKVPATASGVEAFRTLTSEGLSINVTLIFSLRRYEEVIEAYLRGLEERRGDLSGISSVASFFVSRVDTEVDRRLDAAGSSQALSLRGRAAVAQAKLAYEIFQRRFSGRRWDALAARGARLQRPLWASTSTKNPAYSPTLYVDSLIGPQSVNTLPEATVEAFEEQGRLARTVDEGVDEARRCLEDLAEAGVDMNEVTTVLEHEGVAAFAKSFEELLQTLLGRMEALKEGADERFPA